MRKEKHIIDKDNPVHYFELNVEKPILKFDSSRVHFKHYNGVLRDGIAEIEITVYRKLSANETKKILISDISNISRESFPLVDDKNVEGVSIEILTNTFEELTIELVVQFGQDMINIKSPIEAFHKHINDRTNTKIIFSGPFGQGKTTFLEHFFYGENAVNDKYEVFKVFPVNYSVASNEDIFKYIKTDILFQLLAKDIKFDESSPKVTATITPFLKKNITKILAPFLIAVPIIGKDVYTVFQKLDELKDQYIDYHNSLKTDDFKNAEDFISHIYEQEGSLFEDNFYTQLIRQLLGRLKKESKKENVLIIEDLDRMDPDHIFRILNVISAHYDNYNFNGQNEHHNKFGFDKIIIVCDVKNIKNIFHHKYGKNTDFGGYMNKYYSSKAFEYDNKVAIDSFLNEIYKKMTDFGYDNPENTAHIELLNALQKADLLSIREVLKILKSDFNTFNLYDNRYNFNMLLRGRFTKSICFLNEVLTVDVLIEKIEKLKNNNFSEKKNYFDDSKNILASLGKYISNEPNNLFSEFMENKFKLNYFEFSGIDIINKVDIVEINSLEPKNSNFKNFDHQDFYSLILLVIERYQFILRNN